MTPWARPRIPGVVSASAGRRGLVLLHHAGRDAPMLADRDALVFRPGPYIAAALPAGPGTPRLAGLCPPGLAGVLDERHELLTERGGVLLAQVNLIVAAAEGEPYRFGGRAAVKVVFQRDGYSLGHLTLPNCDGACNLSTRASPATAATPQIGDEIPGKLAACPERVNRGSAYASLAPSRSSVRHALLSASQRLAHEDPPICMFLGGRIPAIQACVNG